MLVYMDGLKKSHFFYIFLILSLAFLSSNVLAHPGTWWGFVTVDGNAAANSTPVTAYCDNIAKATVNTITVVPNASGYYIVDILCTTGQNVTFKVYGVSAYPTNQTPETWSEGYHPNTTSFFNLTMNTPANTAAAGTTGGTTTGGGVAANVTKNISSASPTSPAVVNMGANDSNALKVDQVTVRVTETVSNVQITVKDASLPAGASLAISSDNGATYKYLNITTTIPSSKIANVTIKFKVEKSWMTANNINSSTIALERYVNSQWVKLTTTKLSEDSTYIYFEAQSPGLSIFAIIGEKNITPSVTPSCPTCPQPSAWSDCIDNKQTRTNYKCDATTNYICQSYTETTDCKPTSIWTSAWVRVLAVVIVLALLWWLTRVILKRKKIEYHETK